MLQFAINNNAGNKNNCWICRISWTALDNEWKGRSVSHAMQECFISHFLLLVCFFTSYYILLICSYSFLNFYFASHFQFLSLTFANVCLKSACKKFFLSKVLWAACFRRSEREGGDLSISPLEKFTYLSIYPRKSFSRTE